MIKIKKLTNSEEKKFDKQFSKEWGKYDLSIGISPNAKSHAFIAKEDKKIIGYFTCKIWGGTSYLRHLLVFDTLRGKGMGQKLLKAYEDFSKKQKCHVCYLETSQNHNPAIKFYEKSGYKKVAILKNNKFNLDWYFYEKRIK